MAASTAGRVPGRRAGRGGAGLRDFREARLAHFSGAPPLHFNVSHAGAFALLGFTRAGPIGVDLEDTRREIEADEIAARFFARGEAAALRGLPPESRRRVFFRLWTCKEAMLKARGVGLAAGLAAVEIAWRDDETVELTRTRTMPHRRAHGRCGYSSRSRIISPPWRSRAQVRPCG